MDQLAKLKKNIISWYPINEGQTVLQIGQDEEIFKELKSKTEKVTVLDAKKLKETSDKYDFIVLIGTFETLDTEKEILNLLSFAKKAMSQDGKILLAMQNKFGMKYWAGNQDCEPIIFSKENILSFAKIKNILKNLNLKFKFYYPLPDYQFTNVIYTDAFLPDNDSMDARVLTFCEEENILNFSEKEAYKQLIKEQKDLFPFFSNSYFIEISNTENFEEIKYVSYSMIRKQEYSIKTVIKTDFVYKTANHSTASKHIEKIANNIKILNDCHINCLDKSEKDVIISSYLKDAKSFDAVLMEIYEKQGLNATIIKIKEFYDQILKKLLKQEVDFNHTVFEKYQIEIPQNLKEKLHFTPYGLYDLIFQNCLVKENEIFVYDQEWYEENIPIEFILYRAILYFTELKARENMEVLCRKLDLTDFVKYFEELDDKIQQKIKNEEIWNFYIHSLHEIQDKREFLHGYKKRMELTNNHIRNLENKIEVYEKDIETFQTNRKEYEKNIQLSNTHIENLKSDLAISQKEVQNLEQQMQEKEAEIRNYVNQLQVIGNSLSWKMTKPLRYLSWVLNFKHKIKLVDRLMPPGSGMRHRYEQKRHQHFLNIATKRFCKYMDKETAKAWAILLEKANDARNKRIIQTPYDAWIKNNEPTMEELEKQRNCLFDIQPKISVVVPLYHTSTEFFRELLFFMNQQTYPNWELCLADGSEYPLEEIQKMCAKDPRIKYQFLGENKGISENTNRAIEMATGDYIGLLDHDDLLSEDCLYEVVKNINENPNVEFIYTDEDKISSVGEERYDAYFKSDFAPDTLRSQNYICHFSVFKKELMDKLGGFRSDYDGAQDYDIVLRMSEIVKEENIKHIPKILYHWRMHKESTAMDASAKPWAFEAGKKALEAHIQRIGLPGIVNNGKALGTYEIEYEVQGNPKVSILIPNKDGIEVLKVCIDSILQKTTYNNYEIMIIENNSTESKTFDYYETIKQNPKIKVLYYTEKGFNYSKIINFGVRNSDGDFIIQLNNDTELITPNWLEKMLGYCQRKEIGAVGVKLYFPDETVQHSGVLLGLGGIAGHLHRGIGKEEYGYFSKAVTIQNMSAVTAACIMTKKETYEEVGYMNEKLAVAFNDIDFCLKIRKAAYFVIYHPYVEFWHYESKTRGSENTPEKIKRFNQEIHIFKEYWSEEIKKGDPYYNKNLRLDNDQYAIKTEKLED